MNFNGQMVKTMKNTLKHVAYYTNGVNNRKNIGK